MSIPLKEETGSSTILELFVEDLLIIITINIVVVDDVA